MRASKMTVTAKRSKWIIAISLAAWVIILVRLFILQIVKYDEYQAAVVDNIQRETTVTAPRGTIYDSNMTALAVNQTAWRVFISPRDITGTMQAVQISTNLSDILGVEFDTIYEKTQKVKRADETIKKDVDEETANLVLAFISANDLDTQIHLESYTKRYYPFGNLASQVLGIVGTDGGLIGTELEYDDELTGIAGKYITARDATGKKMPFKYDSYIEAKNGYSLVTTLNREMQAILENQLEETYIESTAINRVTGIVMNPNDGSIYAMGTYPNFNLNDPYTLDTASQTALDELALAADSEEYQTAYWQAINAMWKNKAVSELYEPGSTFKVITTAMALEEKAVSFSDTFFCGGSLKVEGYGQPIGCHRKSGHGTVTFARGLQQSCNPTLMQVAAKIGREKFYKYFQAFGYTEITGVDLPGEASSLYSSFSNFNQVELAVYSFGQTFKVTPLQQITGISSVANGGYLVTPHIVDSIIDSDGNVISSFTENDRRQVVSSEICSMISNVLEEGVSTDGGAKNTYVPGYKIAAKTGTSQVRDVLDDNGQSYLVVGSTVAYAPSDNPQVAVLIVVDSPQCATTYGSVVAAPYVANVLKEILPILGVERNYTEAELSSIETTVANYVDWELENATVNIKNKGLTYEVVGNGTTVTMQVPSGGSHLRKDSGKVILYTGEATPETSKTKVPNVLNMTSEQATRVIVNSGFNVSIDGTETTASTSCVVTAQSPAAGEEFSLGEVVTITVRYLDGTE